MSTVNPLVEDVHLHGEGGGSVGSDESPTQDHLPMIRSTNARSLTRQEAEDNLKALVDSVHLSHQMQLRLWTFILAVANAADAVEISVVGYIMSALNDDINSLDKETLTSGVFIGMLFGGLVAGFLSDNYGRKCILLYSLAINALAGFFCAFVPDIEYLIVFRVIAGVGIGGSVPTVFSLCCEIFPVSVRGQLISVVAAFWMVGTILTALLAYIVLEVTNNSWKLLAALSSFPAFIGLLMALYYLPESPIFLLRKKRFTQCLVAIRAMLGPDIDIDVDSISFIDDNLGEARVSRLKSESSVSSSSYEPHRGSCLLSCCPNRIAEYICNLWIWFTIDLPNLRLWKDESIRSSLVTLGSIWFLLSFGSYGITTWISELFDDIGITDVYLASLIVALATLPGNIVAVVYIDQIGRRPLLIYGMILSALVAGGLPFGENYPAVVVGCAALFNAFSIVGWNALDCISVEYFPIDIRTSAMGVLAAMGRIGAIAGQFVNGSLESNIALLFFVTAGCMFLGGGIGFCLDKNKDQGVDIVL